MSKYLSPRFDSLDAYTPGEQPRDQKYIKLNTNECPYPPSSKVIEAIDKEKNLLNLYPDPTAKCLKTAIADNLGLNADNIFVANGSDEVLALSFMAFCDKDTGVAYPDISYGFYSVYADLFTLDSKVIPLKDDFSVCPNDYFNLGRTIFIANPNAPTGLCLSLYDIENILINNKNNIVVIDEAYVDFGGESTVKLLDRYENLLVVRTFSKSRNLAGGRVGFALGSKELIADLELMKFSFNPYNINRLSLVSATEAMKDTVYFDDCVSKIKDTRTFLVNELEGLGFNVIPSCANFIFAKKDGISGEELYLKLKNNGILIRHFNKDRISDYIRITIGTKDEIISLIDTIKTIIDEVK
ncbi:MAG: histidinol-phosphate transaminase [Clostridia bacterium]|nr:histidinol-phosphate transaminase [Clostridia bacterium]